VSDNYLVVEGGDLEGKLTVLPGEIPEQTLIFHHGLPKRNCKGVSYVRVVINSTRRWTAEAWYLQVQGDSRIWHSSNGKIFSPFDCELPPAHAQLLKEARTGITW
jgi:hypothetical protein